MSILGVSSYWLPPPIRTQNDLLDQLSNFFHLLDTMIAKEDTGMEVVSRIWRMAMAT